jgi:hypothetical protein
MQWWNDFMEWASTGEGLRTVAQTALPFVAIVLAGVIAALIGRAAVRHSLGLAEQELTRGVLAAVIGSGRQYAVWDTLTPAEQQFAAIAAGEAEVRLRMLPRSGAEVAADWSLHELEELKRNSIDFGRNSEHSFAEFRDRLVEWHFRPRKARKLFLQDLERWRFERSESSQQTQEQQRQWQAQQNRPAPTASDVANRLAARDSERSAESAPPTAAPVVSAPAASGAPTASSAPAATPASHDEPAPVPTSLPAASPSAADPNATAPYQPVSAPRPTASSVASPADSTDTGVVVEATDPPKSAFRRDQD